MKCMPETIREGCLTVGQVTKELLQQDPHALAFFQEAGSRRVFPINTVDAYHEDEIVIALHTRGIWLRAGTYGDFDEDKEETIVVLGTE